MNPLTIKIMLVVALAAFSGYTTLIYKAGVNSCKVSINETSEKQFKDALKKKQDELDAALKLKREWEQTATDLQNTKPPEVTHEKENIKNDNAGCSSIDGFSLFILKLQEGYTGDSVATD
jgi:hypothetical protein